jgi:hypothetical protein
LIVVRRQQAKVELLFAFRSVGEARSALLIQTLPMINARPAKTAVPAEFAWTVRRTKIIGCAGLNS